MLLNTARHLILLTCYLHVHTDPLDSALGELKTALLLSDQELKYHLHSI